MSLTQTPVAGNELLGRFTGADLPGLETVEHRRGEEVVPGGHPAGPVYFPVSGVYSVVVRVGDRRGVEAGEVGRDGLFGLAAVFGLRSEPVAVVTRIPGRCLRLSADAYRAASAARPEFERAVRGYVARAWRGGLQAVVCCRTHPVEGRLASLLLRTHDRVQGDTFELTQTELADMLGASRQTVTVAAGEFQRAGLIAYQRGQVRVADRRRLEATACECYAVLRAFADAGVG